MNLKEWRESKRLSQEEAAKLVGTVQPLWSRWESGNTQPSLHYAQRIITATAGAVTLADLMKKPDAEGKGEGA